MNQTKRLALFSLVLYAIVAFAGPDYDGVTQGQPKDVVQFIDREIACHYWPGEMPNDADSAEARASGRPQMIEKELKKNQCTRLEKDEKALRSKYKNKKNVLEALDRAENLTPAD